MQEPSWVKLPSVVLRLLQVWGAIVYAAINALLVSAIFSTATLWSDEGAIWGFLTALVMGLAVSVVPFIFVFRPWAVLYTSPGSTLLQTGVWATLLLWWGFGLLPPYFGFLWTTHFIDKLFPTIGLLVLVVVALSLSFFILLIVTSAHPKYFKLRTCLMRCWNWYTSSFLAPFVLRDMEYDYMNGDLPPENYTIG